MTDRECARAHDNYLDPDRQFADYDKDDRSWEEYDDDFDTDDLPHAAETVRWSNSEYTEAAIAAGGTLRRASVKAEFQLVG